MPEEILTLSLLAKDFEVTSEEILKLAKSCGISTQNDRALTPKETDKMKVISSYRDTGLISVYGDENEERFADSVFQKVAAIFAHNYELTVITQDKDLTQDLLSMARMRSVRNRKIKVFKISGKGQLEPAQWEGVKK